MSRQDPELLLALVALSETFDGINTMVRHEAEHRSGQPDVPTTEVTLLRLLLRVSGLTLAECAATAEQPVTETRRALQDLERRGLVATSASPGRTTTFAATPAAAALRGAARERAAQHLRYALAALPAAEVEDLARASGALASLAASLGFRDVHPTYRQD
ncbi:hypothetical protein [Cellulomonas sp. PhB150]|uniref:hypothetical protein n=1 Tax=Cellulomonas sp. PhB150 TaxID=2485188 RepID=UPI000F496267|nr:hypothetical protein [Cellulomonas sp. PhB150]ROS31351.1 hypothetical protein EDF34_1007 [Cellulomonas sp. PhB150]